MQESKRHRKYEQQFKEEAVRLVTEGGRSVTDVANGLYSLHESSKYQFGILIVG